MFITQMTKMLVSYNMYTESHQERALTDKLETNEKRETLSSGIEDIKKKQMINLEQKKYNCRISESETRSLEIIQSE